MADALHNWYRQLSTRILPVFESAVQRVLAALNDPQSTAFEVSQAVLMDPGLCYKLLCNANRPSQMAARGAVHNLQRAIVILGYDEVRALTLNAITVEKLLPGYSARQPLYRWLAANYHAGLLAQTLAIEMNDPDPCDIFLAALLSRIGMLFLQSNNTRTAEALTAACRDNPEAQRQLELDILGFTLDALSLYVLRDSAMHKLITLTLKGNGPGTSRLQGVRLCHKLSECLMQRCDWNQEAVHPILHQLARFARLDINKTKHILMDTSRSGYRQLCQQLHHRPLQDYYPYQDPRQL